MSLSPEATKVFDHLPTDGTKIGGITLQRELNLSHEEYQKAREELKAEYLVVTGRGRGGSLARLDVEEPPKDEEVMEPQKDEANPQPEPKKEVTPAERMAHAREAKVANSRERKQTLDFKERAQKFMHERGYTQVELQHVTFRGTDYEQPLIEVWDGRVALIYTIEPLQWDMLRAERRIDA